MRALRLPRAALPGIVLGGALLVSTYLAVGGLAGAATTESSANYTYSATVPDKTPGAPRAITNTLTVPWPGNIKDATVVGFDPAASMTRSCNLDTDADELADAFDGNADGDATGGVGEEDLLTGSCLRATDQVGTQTDAVYLGLQGATCSTLTAVTVDMWAVALPDDVTDPRSSSNIAYTQPEGTTDRFDHWGTTPVSGQDYISVGGGSPVVLNGSQAAANNISFKNYPEYLLDMFDPDGEAGPGAPVVPWAVYGGMHRLVNATNVPIYFAWFPNGVLPGAFAAPHPYNQTVSGMWTMIPVWEDPTASGDNPSIVSAFCAMSPATTFNADVNGITRATNPATGTKFNLLWVGSARDLDNDGIEAPLDTCARVPNIDGDPRSSGSDPDTDMIDSACDAFPGTADSDDYDTDGYYNTEDNCPFSGNATQANQEMQIAGGGGYTNGAANDGGPLDDGIGDTCDLGDVGVTYNGIATVISLSTTVANGRWQAKGLVVPNCYGGTDADFPAPDGYCTTEDAFPLVQERWSSWLNTPAISSVLGKPVVGGPAGSWDTDHGGGDPLTGGDGLADRGFDSDWIETYIGTDARQACALTVGTADEPLDAYMYDINGNGQTTITDMLAVPMLNAVASTPALRRFDWNIDGYVALNDLLSMGPFHGANCRVPTGVAPGPQ